MRPLLAAVLLALIAPAVAASPERDRLLDLIEHRAALMDDVARDKFRRGAAITDPAREAALLDAATATAAEAGLEAAGARAFVAAQMAVSRSIQASRFETWARTGTPDPGPDLVRALRPAIGATTTVLLEVLPRVLPLLDDAAALRTELDARLAPLGADAASIDGLAEALAALRAAPPAPAGPVARIRAAGVLRVGTTFDYAPFSSRTEDGEPAGIDVDLARDLGSALGVEVRFVGTSWPTLMDDLSAGRFDLALSGISRTTARARSADFSAPYHVGGKTPIVRCADAGTLDGLDAIDRPDVRAIVNPGGTNERFVRARLEQASLRLFEDNRRIFDEIAEGRADVMFTDAIEVRLQSARDPRLCPAMPRRTLTYQEKGVLMPRHASGALVRFVDLWLAQRRGDGTLAAIFERHLAGAP
jgi:cyclohexadienyl dehydratase